MEKSSQSSFLKSLALAFGDGLLFGVAMKFAHNTSKTREDQMTDLGPLAEGLRKVEDQTQSVDKKALTKLGEGLDGRVFEKVIVALEARLTEHVGLVDRRVAEIDAQVALDLKALDTYSAAQFNAVEKAIHQIEAQVRDYVVEAQQASAERISGVDRELNALQEALPGKFREIVDAVRQSMEARVVLELTEMENRVSSRVAVPEQFLEVQANLRGEVEALSVRLSREMRDLAEHQRGQTAPLQQAFQQLETKLTTLREELPPKLRQIVEAVEASMDARISAGERQAADWTVGFENALAALRVQMPSAGGFHQAGEENLRRHAERVGALEQKLAILQEELPPKIKAIVDAVRESLDARMAIGLQDLEERHNAQVQRVEIRFSAAEEEFRRHVADDSQTAALEHSAEKLHADLAAIDARIETSGRQVADHLASLEQHAAQVTAGVAGELESLQTQHRSQIERLEARLRAERAAENVPAQIDSAVAGLRQSLEAKLAAELHGLEGRTPERSSDVERILQYTALLEARVQTLEQKLQRSAEETADRAVERVWQALESRLPQREELASPAAGRPLETIGGLRQKTTSAEQSVLDLIAGIGQLFERPVARETPRAEAGLPIEPHAVPEPVAEEHVEPETNAEPKPPELVAVEAVPPCQPEPAAVATAAAAAVEEFGEPKLEQKPPVILFKPKDSGRKWRIPFVSSFLLMAAAIAWLQFM